MMDTVCHQCGLVAPYHHIDCSVGATHPTASVVSDYPLDDPTASAPKIPEPSTPPPVRPTREQQRAMDLQHKSLAFLKYAKDLGAFCHDILGYHDLLPTHYQLCHYLQDDPADIKLILMPRYSFKSCVVTIGYSLWSLARDPDASTRILIYSDAVTRAEAFLGDIKHHLLGLKAHSTFRTLYGPWEVDPKRGVWNQSAIVVRPRQTAHAEPNIDTAGLESSKVGAHYDLIIFDDLVTKENTTTKDLMDKVAQCYQAARSLLKPGGQVLLVGTRWHFGDLYGRLLAQPPTQAFSSFIRDAEQGPAPDHEPYPFKTIGLTPSFLAEQKRTQGTRLYSALYRLNPQDDETAIFKSTDFRFYDPLSLPDHFRDSLYVTACIDPAISQATDADQTAITIIGTDATNTLYLLDAQAGHWLPEDTLQRLMQLHSKWRIDHVGLETNAFQKMLKHALNEKIDEERRTNPAFRFFQLTEFTGTSSTNKALRIQGLQPYHERGALKLPGQKLELLQGVYSDLAFQMLQFPFAPHDDILDSLAYHLQILRKGSDTVTPATIPPLSPAALEREWFEKELALRRRLPRWQRQPLPQRAFS